MAAMTSDRQIVKIDEGAVNARILARESKADFRRVEAASIKVLARFTSAEGKRLFARYFSTLQLNVHFISVITRTRLESADVAKVEAAIKARIEGVATLLNQAIDGAEALFKANGVPCAATYDTQPMEIEVGIISSTGRRYLELIAKLDQLMPLLQTLEIHEVIDTQVLDQQRASLKRQVRDVANSARSLASGLRRRMNAMAAPPGPFARGDGAAGGAHERTEEGPQNSVDEASTAVAEEGADALSGAPVADPEATVSEASASESGTEGDGGD